MIDICKACAGTGMIWKAGNVYEGCEVDVPQGAAHGDTIHFSGKADEQPGWETGNLLVVLHEEEHCRFQRRGADLFLNMDISLVEAVKDQGMPLKGQPFRFGDLLLRLKVCFPKRLDVEHMRAVQALLPQQIHAQDGKVCDFTDKNPLDD
ncbi:Chaperone protein dnaJ 2 (AtDjA2) [Durusdinium trenchii]|uniref:Chaperone protein dnaJ 2 (AtDjA2) n=1 Tax=Durusdinium trenchii TaxID=1381693 RepID=A0ABP0JVM2_9DINO